MCGIVGLHLREASLYPQLGKLLGGMIDTMTDRGPDSAGMAIYGHRPWSPEGQTTITVLDLPDSAAVLDRLTAVLRQPITAVDLAPNTILCGDVDHELFLSALRSVAPEVTVIGFGSEVTVLKGVGHPSELARSFGLDEATGWQGVGHTRMATESAVTISGSHPFSVGPDQCVVHNGSFANHLTIRRQLEYDGVRFDTDNDSEVGARFIAHHLDQGADLEKALRMLCETFDGFYTLLVSTKDSFAVVRDAIACKPAIIAETEDWVAMASEYRALAHLPGAASARIFEPAPEEVYVWHR